MGRWILLRHGESEANADGIFSGHMDVPLTLWGFQQSLRAGQALRHERIGRVIASDLVRAVDTAKAAMSGRAWGLRTTPALRERHLGAWTGRSVKDVKALGGWSVMHDLHAAPPEGESLADVARRALPVLDRVDDGRPTLVVGHGGLVRVLLGLADHTDPRRIGDSYIPNALPIVRDLPQGTWRACLERVHALAGASHDR